MSYTPWQPATPPSKPDRKRPFIALAALIVAVIVLTLLGLNYLRLAGNPTSIAALPTPTTVALLEPTPGRSGGLNGPEAGTVTSTPQPAPTVEAQGTSAPPVTPSATSLSPAEQALLALESTSVPPRDLYSIAARLK